MSSKTKLCLMENTEGFRHSLALLWLHTCPGIADTVHSCHTFQEIWWTPWEAHLCQNTGTCRKAKHNVNYFLAQLLPRENKTKNEWIGYFKVVSRKIKLQVRMKHNQLIHWKYRLFLRGKPCPEGHSFCTEHNTLTHSRSRFFLEN